MNSQQDDLVLNVSVGVSHYVNMDLVVVLA